MTARTRNTAHLVLCVSTVVLAGAAAVRGATATISQTRTDTENTVVMENPFVRLVVDLRHGARVTAFLYKSLDREWVSSGQGLFADHVWQQTWPGELYRAAYDCEITARGPARVAVKVWRTLERKGMDRVIGVKVERTLSLSATSPVVCADVTLSNPTDQVKTVGYWSQHIFRLAGLNDNYAIRPGATGLAVGTFRHSDEGRSRERIGDEWVKEPVAGWTAVVNPTTGEGAVFLMDYNDLRWLYNCIGHYTTEWYYDLLRMVPGSRWATRIRLVPVQGYRGVSFACEPLIADVRLMRSAEGFRLVYTLGSTGGVLRDVVVGAQAVGPRGRVLGNDTLRVKSLGYSPREVVSSIAVPHTGDPFVVKVTVRGRGFSHAFEKHFGRHNRADRLVAGVFDTGYSIKPPPKKKVLDRPANLRKRPHAGVAVFEARGQFFSAWRLDEALKGLGKHTFKPGHFSSNVYGEQLDYFPAGYGEIMGLDAVVLNNVSAEALSPNDQALLVDYVRHGGGLLVLGGWYAFGGGRYADSALAKLLPVVCAPPFDIKPHKPGLALTRGPGRLFSRIDWSGDPIVLWRQDVAGIKKGAQVVLKAGDKPFVVVWKHGEGRVACVLASVTGTSTPTGKVFFEWRQWPAVLGELLQWLKGDGP